MQAKVKNKFAETCTTRKLHRS